MASTIKPAWLTSEGLEKIENWAKKGLSIKEIAHNMEISEGCLYKWQRENDQISSALKSGRKTANEIVENSLFKLANGYEWTQETIQETRDGTFKKTVTQHVKPDFSAQKYWLGTKAQAVWGKKEKLELEKLKAEIERLKQGSLIDEEIGSNLLEALKGIVPDEPEKD